MDIVAAVTKHAIAACLLGLALVTPAWAQPADETGAGQADAQTESELLALHDAWAAARIGADIAFLEDFYAPEFRVQAMNGSVVSRADDIAAFADGIIKPETIEDLDMDVSLYGDTAIVTGVENLKGTAGGVPGEMALRFTNVFVRRDGRWQIVLHHSTPTQGD